MTWNGAHLLPDCLRALAREGVAVTVVDNASTDGTAELVRRDFPRVRLVLLPENVGYGRGNNEGMRRALEEGARFVALINNDVRVEPGFFGRLLAAAARVPAGLFTGTLLFADSEVVNSTGLEIDRFGRARDRDFRVPLHELRRRDGPADGVSGGAALIRAETLREVGLFDPGYFAYYEDVDLSLRARRAGYGSYYVREARARHLFGATFGPGSPRQRYLLGRGHLRTLALHQPLWKAALLVPATAAFRVAVKAPLELARLRPAHALAEVRAAASGLLAALTARRSRTRR